MRIQTNAATAQPTTDAAAPADRVVNNRAEFEHDTLEIAAQVRKSAGSPAVAVAPFAGTRIAGFRELDLDGLVMVDWSRPGSEAEVRKALADAKFWKAQRDVKGGESSKDIIDTPVTAQILAKLQIELGVNRVTVTRFAEAGDTPDVARGTVDDKTKPFVTRFDFVWNGKPRSIAFVSWAISGDTAVPGREPMPNDLLRKLRPDGFGWGYLAADGVGFFSRDPHNGLQGASRTLVRNLAPGGGVLLDDPRHATYVNGGQDFAGMHLMRGRARLEPYGVRQIGALKVPENTYGYTGMTPNDRVRAYQKPGVAAPTMRPVIDTSSMTRGESITYVVNPL